MADISRAQGAAVVAYAVGLRGDKLVTAIAVAMGESGGNPRATGDKDNPKPGCGSYGLWQINSCPGRDGSGAPRYGSNPQTLYNPVTNAFSMMAISTNGQNWKPWTIWRTGAYKNHLGTARAAVTWLDTPGGKGAVEAVKKGGGLADDLGQGLDSVLPGDGLGPLDGALQGIDAVGAFFSLLTTWDTWRRVLFVVLGLAALAAIPALLGRDLVPLPIPK